MNTTASRTVVTLAALAMTMGIALPVAAQDGSRLERVQARIAQRDGEDTRREKRQDRREDRSEKREENRGDNRPEPRGDSNRGQNRGDNRGDARNDRRDDRQERRDDRHDRRDDRREVRQDRRDDRREFRQDRREQVARVRAQQAYNDRLRAQQRYWSTTRYNAYFNTPMTHRYAIGGRYYQTNRYGVDIIRQAAQHGYAEGVRAGQADRYDGWRYDYRDSWAYRDGGFGYHGRYIDRQHYAHYFREGFRRGYEDGYYGQGRYGRYDNRAGQYLMIGAILAAILNID